MTKVKICGLFRECDIDYVNEAKPDFAGFIIDFPKSHRNLSPERVKILRAKLDPEIKAVGVFVNKPASEVHDIASEAGLDIIQLHGDEDEDYIKELRSIGSQRIWKAYRISPATDLKKIAKCPADMLLLDAGYGEGRAFDWELAKGIDRPYILAGGLTPESIPDAIRKLNPYGIDISSGVERDKNKDREKIMAAVRAARQ